MAGYFDKNFRRGERGEHRETDKKTSALSASSAVNSTIHTGDLGYLDGDGDLWIVQRRSDLIVSGGENVYPAEVEAVLRGHTAVTEACVVGIADAEWGQRVVAMVQVAENATVSPDDLIAFCREHLAGYKIPRHIRLVEQLPLTASGKIGRKQISEQLQELF
jgi:O-succinylbenzoic acid--CoA ligase